MFTNLLGLKLSIKNLEGLNINRGNIAVSAFTHYIKGLSPSSLDMELRMLQIIDDDESLEPSKRPEMLSLDMLLDYFIHEISCRHNFEFMQAVVRLFLKVRSFPVCFHHSFASVPPLKKRKEMVDTWKDRMFWFVFRKQAKHTIFCELQ